MSKEKLFDEDYIKEQESGRFRTLLNELNAALFEWDIKNNEFFASKTYLKYALSMNSLEDIFHNKGSLDSVHPEDVDTLKRFFRDTQTGQHRIETTLRLKLMDGDYRWCHIIVLFYKDEEGKPERAIGIILDINTEREQATMLSSVLNIMPGGVGIWRFAEVLECQYYNEGFAKMAGISTEEMDRRIANNTVLSSLIAPVDFEYISTKLMELVAQGKPLDLTYRYVYSDGSIRWLQLAGMKLRDENGFPVYYCMFTSPTNEAAMYRSIVEDAGTGVIVADVKYRNLVYINNAARKIYHISKDIVGIVNVMNKLSESGRELLLSEKQIASMNKEHYTYFHVEYEGKYYVVSGKIIFWNGLESYIIYIVDETITKLAVEMERQLKESEEISLAKSRFLNRMSHEIRTPINAIIGIAELERQDAQANIISKDSVLEYAKDTKNAAHYLLQLVNDVLDSAKIDSDKIVIHPYPINVDEFIKSVETLVNPMAVSHNINFSIERYSRLAEHYEADGIRIQQIVMNLLSNAFKFTPPGGTVKVIAEAIDRTDKTTTMQITVQDNGIGMSKEFQKKLFQQFSQEHDSSTSKYGGSGLGLHISRELARLMGGDIVCKSEKEKGTTFIVTIVIGNVEIVPTIKYDKSEIISDIENFQNTRILICEDHPLNQRISKGLLERKNCIVDIAEDGAIGVEMFEKSEINFYSMILMDIRMPNMDGLEAARAIRALPRADANSVPIVAMSANTYAEDIQKSIEAGMNEHLAKPVDAAQLYHTVAKYTSGVTIDIPDKKYKILVVDDIEMNRDMVRRALISEYDVLLAENGKRALELLEQNSDIVAVLTDIQMPEMNGEELIHEIRKDIKYDMVAILANTQFGDELKERNLMKIGADDFIYKPISPTLLSLRLKNVLARRQHIL